VILSPTQAPLDYWCNFPLTLLQESKGVLPSGEKATFPLPQRGGVRGEGGGGVREDFFAMPLS